jgi:SAM-dependent methyltransferase
MSVRNTIASYINRLRYGLRLDTDGYIALEDLALAADGRRDYGPSGWRTIERLAKRVPLGPDDVFVDYGCGKGRVVYLAARRPMKRVIGVELAPDLAEIARRNVETYRSRLACRNVEIVCSDAVSWPVPDDLTIAFFYSPFTGDLFRAVLENLRRSVERHPRAMWVIHQRLTSSGPDHPAVRCSEYIATQRWLDAVERVPNNNAVLECFRVRRDR